MLTGPLTYPQCRSGEMTLRKITRYRMAHPSFSGWGGFQALRPSGAMPMKGQGPRYNVSCDGP